MATTTTDSVHPRSSLDSPRCLHGVGEVLERRLAAAGVHTLRDLLQWFPRRLRELEEIREFGPAAVGRWVRVVGRVESSRLAFLGARRSVVTVRLTAEDGSPFEVALFNQPYLVRSFEPGSRRVVEGVLELARGPSRRGGAALWSLKQGRILGTGAQPDGACQLRYAEIEGVPEARLKALIQQALRVVDLADWPDDELPASLAPEELGGPSLAAALRAMHLPATAAEHDAARRRFAVLEAVQLFRRVERARRGRLRRRGLAVAVSAEVEARIAGVLPFTWSADQAAAVQTLRAQLAGPAPMGVLLQGDVGTGKTAVALYAALAVIAAGHQVAFLAPTELLAEQHHEGLSAWLRDRAVRVALLTSSLGTAERRELAAGMQSGAIHLVIGTHALFSSTTAFARLGLVIVDEQHRFGVEQRMRLVRKGRDPHVLVMTATPIPRTLTLALFGDLDAVTLRTRPRGRPVPAVFVEPADWPRVRRAIARRLARQARVYVVCARIGDDGEKGGAVRLHQELSRHFVCGLVHGRMPAAERREVTAAFRRGDFGVLVGTTVLEVGVDVPEATLMVVIGADRLGLATLHQLRGRVGRGARRGLCVLTGKRSERIEAVCSTTDGFALAEVDLRLRGSGELLGRRQSGIADLRALDALGDLDILSQAREAVRRESSP